MKKSIAVTLLPFALTLAACSSFAPPSPTPTPTATQTAVPTATRLPTESPLPPTEETPKIASALTPEGKPASEWEGIPIMPGAIAGDGDEEGYVFTIRATPQQIQKYYKSELGKLGWQSSVQGEGDDSLRLIFTKDSSVTLTVNILVKGEESLVLLVK